MVGSDASSAYAIGIGEGSRAVSARKCLTECLYKRNVA